MAEEPKTEATPIGNEASSNPEVPPQGTRTDDFNKPEYTRKTQELAELKNFAAQYGYESPKEMLEDVTRRLNELMDNGKPKTTHYSESSTTTGNVLPQNAQELKQLQSQLSSIMQTQSILQINLMYRDFRDEQKELAPEQRLRVTKQEILDFIGQKSNAAVIASEAQDDIERGGDGNWCRIAADMIDLKKRRAELLAKAGETKKALEEAANSTKTMKSEGAPPPEKKEDTPGRKKADYIAPDTRQKFD